MKELLVFVADREADADDVRRALQEASPDTVSLVGLDFAVLDAEAGQWQQTRAGHRLRNLPWTLASLALAGVLTGTAWTGFALGVVSGALARRVRTGWRGGAVDVTEVLQSAVFVVADIQDVEGVTGRLARFDGRVLRVPLPVQDGGAAASAEEVEAATSS